MTSGLTQAALAFCRRRRRWILILAAAGLSGFGAYRVYHSSAETLRLVSSISSSSAETLSLVCSDLNRFLLSDSDEIPSTLKQVAKLAGSDELSTLISGVSKALAVEIIRA